MDKPYLEVPYRQGKPFAAYIYLPRRPGDKVDRTGRRQSMLCDLSSDGRVVGIELTVLDGVRFQRLTPCSRRWISRRWVRRIWRRSWRR